MWGLSSKKIHKNNQDQVVDWFHAVSYGETVVCLQFIKIGLNNKRLNRPILFTSTIQNALDHFCKEINKLQVHNPALKYETNLLPLDFKPSLSQFIGTRKIERFFLVETDFWPCLLFYLRMKNTKLFLINGRISHKISALYTYLRIYGKKVFNCFDKLFVQSELDAKRLSELGIDHQLISVIGNAKYDLIPSESLSESENLITHKDVKVIILGSLHQDELFILDTVNSSLPTNFQIWIAPRKIKDMNLFQRKIKSLNSNYGLYSESKGSLTTHRFVLIDVMGILSKLYQYCDVAIIGGSFNSVGGHNFIEPIMFKRPVIVGPKMRNFEEDIVEFKSRNLIIQVMDEDDLKTVLVKFTEDPRELIEQSVRAYNYVNVKMGSLERTWIQINSQNKIS